MCNWDMDAQGAQEVQAPQELARSCGRLQSFKVLQEEIKYLHTIDPIFYITLFFSKQKKHRIT